MLEDWDSFQQANANLLPQITNLLMKGQIWIRIYKKCKELDVFWFDCYQIHVKNIWFNVQEWITVIFSSYRSELDQYW